FDQRPLYVPNAAFTTIAVENPSRMTNRRISETLGIRLVDAKVVQAIVNDIRDMLKNHDEIDPNRTMIVNLLGYGTSSLDIMLYTFTKTTQWVRFHEVKEDVFLKINEIIESHGAQVALPTRTLHMPNGLQVSSGDEVTRREEPGHDHE
ncbi:MAG TPA: mechanosensitive ion channel family protein, partial [Marinobacter sp.]|nr:mechanosensitive ion channel family protein [Marinobacter sp.]